jgi:hypothetical protein
MTVILTAIALKYPAAKQVAAGAGEGSHVRRSTVKPLMRGCQV